MGSVLVTFFITKFAPEARGHGVPEVMDAIYYREGVIRPVVALVKSLADDRDDCRHDGQRRGVAHMPTAFTTGDSASGGTAFRREYAVREKYPSSVVCDCAAVERRPWFTISVDRPIADNACIAEK